MGSNPILSAKHTLRRGFQQVLALSGNGHSAAVNDSHVRVRDIVNLHPAEGSIGAVGRIKGREIIVGQPRAKQ